MHRVCAVAADGAVLSNRKGANRPANVDRALVEAGAGARVIDQKRSIGALVVARILATGNPVSHLPSACDMFTATAKTGATDAEVITRTAAGMPFSPLASGTPLQTRAGRHVSVCCVHLDDIIREINVASPGNGAACAALDRL